jgi:hypothetical protein
MAVGHDWVNSVVGVGYRFCPDPNTREPLELEYDSNRRFVAIFTGHAVALMPTDLVPLWQRARHAPVRRDEIQAALGEKYSEPEIADIARHLYKNCVFTNLELGLTRYKMLCRSPSGEVMPANELGEERTLGLLRKGWSLEVALLEARGELMRAALEKANA